MSEYEDNLGRVRAIAGDQGWVLNPDDARVRKVVGLMADNFTAVGEYVCPCKQKNKPPVKGQDTLCPCPEVVEEILAEGHCFCHLFFTPEAAAE